MEISTWKASRIDVQQGSFEWLDIRKKHVCASDASIIMGMSPWRTRQELLEEKKGLREVQEINFPMQRGMLLEPQARVLAENLFDNVFIPGVYVSEEYPFMLASYDGISLDEKIILEIKCPGKKAHSDAKKGQIPAYYKPQLQHQIAVCGLDRVHYFSFDGNCGITLREERDGEFIKKMIEMEWDFYQEMIA
jgi:putative phage-type endonuclease